MLWWNGFSELVLLHALFNVNILWMVRSPLQWVELVNRNFARGWSLFFASDCLQPRRLFRGFGLSFVRQVALSNSSDAWILVLANILMGMGCLAGDVRLEGATRERACISTLVEDLGVWLTHNLVLGTRPLVATWSDLTRPYWDLLVWFLGIRLRICCIGLPLFHNFLQLWALGQIFGQNFRLGKWAFVDCNSWQICGSLMLACLIVKRRNALVVNSFNWWNWVDLAPAQPVGCWRTRFALCLQTSLRSIPKLTQRQLLLYLHVIFYSV